MPQALHIALLADATVAVQVHQRGAECLLRGQVEQFLRRGAVVANPSIGVGRNDRDLLRRAENAIEISGLFLQRVVGGVDLTGVTPDTEKRISAFVGDLGQRYLHREQRTIPLAVCPFETVVTLAVSDGHHLFRLVPRRLTVQLPLRRQCRGMQAGERLDRAMAENFRGRLVRHDELTADNQPHRILRQFEQSAVLFLALAQPGLCQVTFGDVLHDADQV